MDKIRIKEFLKREDYIYMDTDTNMSIKGLSNLTYAAIVCQAGLPTFYVLSLHEDRKINTTFKVQVKVHIHPSQIEKFENISALKLRKPPQATLSCLLKQQ